MGLLKSIFTWWDGATIGTNMGTRFGGREVGKDGLGNLYFESKKATDGRRRRWVIYNGSNDASRVPPEWHGWLHNTVDVLPADAPPARAWQQPATPNLTGTRQAYLPSGALEAGGRRAAATGDYEAWTPDPS